MKKTSGSHSTEKKPEVNGIAGALVDLAKSGDNWVKLVIVGGLFYNTVITSKQGTEVQANHTAVQDNTVEIQKFRKVAAQQLKVVFDNQRVMADFFDETR